MIWLSIALGGGIGAVARYGIGGWVQERAGFGFPWGTLVVNVLGSLLRGIAGFGASAKVHTDRILRLSLDLPIVVEVVDTEERIREMLPELDPMIGGGLVTLERAHVILYRPDDSGAGPDHAL